MINMGKWSEQQEQLKEERTRNTTRREKLAGFFFDLAKLCFATVVLGGVTPWITNREVSMSWDIIVYGAIATYIFAFSANRILK